MVRNISFYFGVILCCLIFCPIAAIGGLFGGKGKVPMWAGHMWSKWILRFGWIKIEADLSALPEGGNLIFMANHQSQLDIFVLYTLLKKYVIVFVAKQSLFKIPLLGRSMHGAGHVPIDRSNRRRAMKSIEAATETAKRGRSIIIFPEGSRSLDLEQLSPFMIGGMVMALKCEVPVAPVVISGTGKILPKGGLGLTPGRRTVRVKTLAPIDTKQGYTLKEREKFKEDLYQIMNAAYQEMK